MLLSTISSSEALCSLLCFLNMYATHMLHMCYTCSEISSAVSRRAVLMLLSMIMLLHSLSDRAEAVLCSAWMQLYSHTSLHDFRAASHGKCRHCGAGILSCALVMSFCDQVCDTNAFGCMQITMSQAAPFLKATCASCLTQTCQRSLCSSSVLVGSPSSC